MTVERVDSSFLLNGEGFSYAFTTELRHLYWGGPLDRADLPALAGSGQHRVGSNTWSSPRAHHEEFVAHGGRRFDEGALLVEFADGVTALELVFDSAEIDRSSVAVRLVDSYRPVAVTLRYEVRGPALVRSLSFENKGESPVTLVRAASATWALPWQARYDVTTLSGGYAAETNVRRQPLPLGRFVLESRRGVPGHAHQPWMAVSSSSSSSEMWSVAVAHGGSWKLVAELSGDGYAHVTAGINDFDLRLVVEPGATVELPSVVGVYAASGSSDLTARWHRYERGFVLPRPAEVRPVLYNSWESTFFDVRHDDQVALARLAAGLGVELFVVDDGWFGDRPDDKSGLGDWRPDPAKLPGGLGALADEVHALGMRFGVWVEPESVTPDSALYREHPDWIIRWPDREPAAVRHSYGLDFGLPEVQDWAVGMLDRVVRDGRADFLKWDLNRSLTDTTGLGQLRHEAGFQAVVDRLRAAHPDLWLETCASGGGRADLATLSRFELSWPSDNTDAWERLSIQEGYSLVHSPMTMSCWVTDSPGYLTRRPIPLRFRFHVAMTGILGIGGTIGRWSSDDLAEAGSYVARYKEIRNTVQCGARYRIGSARHDEQFALCCVSDDGAQVALFVFARTVRQDSGDPPVRLRGLDPAARYRDVDRGTEYGGAFLMWHGLRASLSGDYASALFVFERV